MSQQVRQDVQQASVGQDMIVASALASIKPIIQVVLSDLVNDPNTITKPHNSHYISRHPCFCF
ncbi:MAG: hypothetical protein RXQ95_06885 [Vulcanisaeta sp.]